MPSVSSSSRVAGGKLPSPGSHRTGLVDHTSGSAKHCHKANSTDLPSPRRRGVRKDVDLKSTCLKKPPASAGGGLLSSLYQQNPRLQPGDVPLLSPSGLVSLRRLRSASLRLKARVFPEGDNNALAIIGPDAIFSSNPVVRVTPAARLFDSLDFAIRRSHAFATGTPEAFPSLPLSDLCRSGLAANTSSSCRCLTLCILLSPLLHRHYPASSLP
jgi:hypothetical protein